MFKRNKLITNRMEHIVKILEKNTVNNGTEDNPILTNIPMTIEQISDTGSKILDEKGMCNKYTHNQVNASVYGLYRRGIVEIDNTSNLDNPTMYKKDTVVKLREIKIQ